MKKTRIEIIFAVIMLLGIGNVGLLTLIPMAGQLNGVLIPFRDSPITSNAGDLVQNPYFDGTWQNDWLVTELSTSIIQQQSVRSFAAHYAINWLTWSCEENKDEDITSSATSRDDGSVSFSNGITLTKMGSGTSSYLRYQVHLLSSGYAYAQAGESDTGCSESTASVSWSFDDTVTYTRRITQTLNNFDEANTLTYAVFSAKYKMLSTMTGSEEWHAKVVFKLQAPNGDTIQTGMGYFESQALNGVEQSFDQGVLAFMQDHGLGVYKYIIEFEFSMHHEDTRSDSDSGMDGATATTPSVTYDDYVSLDFYGAHLSYTTTLAPPTLNTISPNPDTDGQVELSWNRVYGATQYLIYRNNTAEITGLIDQTTLDTVDDGNITTWTDTTAPRGDNWYVVVAYDARNLSPLSTCQKVEVILKPDAITDLDDADTAQPDDDGEFTINWTAAEQATSYKIYMETTLFSSLNELTPVATTPGTSYSIGPVLDGTYYIAVVGTNIAGDGAISNVISVDVTIVNPPNAPEWVESGPMTVFQNRVDLNWKPSFGAWNYTVYRNSTPLLNTKLTSFRDYNLVNGNIYNYTVTAWNYKGESVVPNEDYLVNCSIPDIFDNIAAWMATLDPMVYNIIYKAVDAIIGTTGTDVLDFLSDRSNYAQVTFNLSLGDYEVSAGINLKLGFQVDLTLSDLTPSTSYVRFVIIPKTTTTFALGDMSFGTPFESIAEIIDQASLYGVSITPSLFVAGKIDFQIAIATSDITVNEIAIEFKPMIVTQLDVLQCILAVAAPEAEPVVSSIASIIDLLTGYDIYDVLTCQLTISIDIIARYFPTSGKEVLDIVLDVELDAIRINFAQPRKNDHYEIVAGMTGQTGIHWETGSDLTWCGQLYFFLAFDFQDVKISLVRNFLQQAVDWTDLSYDAPNVYYLIGPQSACTPISLKTPSIASVTDTDNDYLSNAEEALYNTNPELPDSDGDGLWDYLEIEIGSNASVLDTDNDGIMDGQEYLLGTNASRSDTDSDGLADGVEVRLGTNPLSVDTDGDLLWDNDELTEGTNPLVADTDQDGYADGWEIYWYGTNAKSTTDAPVDTDNDALLDKDETFLFQTNPNDNDALDSDGDGLTNGVENILYGSSIFLADTDDDGLNDNIEIANGIYFLDPDSDLDRLLDGEEFLSYGTDPLKQDTDGDGYTDYLEIVLGSDPLNEYNTPEEYKKEDYALYYAFFIGMSVAAGAIFGIWAFQRYFGNPLRGLKLRGAASKTMNRAVRRVQGKPIEPRSLPEGVQGPVEKTLTKMEQMAKSKIHALRKKRRAKGFWGNIQT